MSNENVSNGMPMIIHAQYVRDASFENPMAPQSLRSTKTPTTSVDLNVDSHRVESTEGDYRYEVILSARVEAKRDDKTVFLAEVHYGTVVSIQNVPMEHHKPLLLIEIPRLSFPFVRQILGDMINQGGFPPLYMHPVNFHQMYLNRFGDLPADAA